MIKEIKSPLWYKFNGGLRYLLARGVVPFAGQHYVVNEYPKSGGTWLSEMLAEAIDIPFPQHRLPYFQSCILLGHYIEKRPLENPIILFRDGRDVMNSLYFHLVVGHEYSSQRILETFRRRLGITCPEDAREYLPRFIEYVSTNPFFPRFTWAEFVDVWHARSGVVETSYEALKYNTVAELQRIVFARTGIDLSREKGERIVLRKRMGSAATSKNSFRRKGLVGDWRNTFSQEAVDVFKHYNGDALIALGYEKDDSWSLD